MTRFPVEPGRVVVSRAGRDRGRTMLVICLEDADFVRVADGNLRRLEHPKRKRIKHLHATPIRLDILDRPPQGAAKLLDADIRKALEAAETSKSSPTTGEEG